MNPRTAAAALLLTLGVAGCTPTPAATIDPTASPSTSPLTSAPAPSTSSVPGVALAPELAPTATGPVPTPERNAPTTAPGQGIAAGVNRTNPDAVTAAVLTTFFTADTTADHGPNDAAARATALLTPDYAAAILGTPPVRGPGAQWSAWAARGVRLVPVLEALPDDRPSDSTTAAYRIYLITQTPTTTDGQALAPVVTVAYVQLLTTDSGWAVANVDQR
jgi:hypothetical protein